MDKRSARQFVREKIKAMSDEDKQMQSEAVREIIKSFGIKGKKVFCYNSLADEAGTQELIKDLCKDNELYLPVMADKGEMYLVRTDENTPFETNGYSISEPVGQRLLPEQVMPDICITPLRAFDSKLNRAGRGKGYYDRFFSKCDCEKIGIAFNEQYVQEIQTEDTDVRLDKVVTQGRIYTK